MTYLCSTQPASPGPDADFTAPCPTCGRDCPWEAWRIDVDVSSGMRSFSAPKCPDCGQEAAA